MPKALVLDSGTSLKDKEGLALVVGSRNPAYGALNPARERLPLDHFKHIKDRDSCEEASDIYDLGDIDLFRPHCEVPGGVDGAPNVPRNRPRRGLQNERRDHRHGNEDYRA
jgi:hypothetical protein